jgi:RNA polymerase sigma-70 factor, ECF subfamily
MGTVILACEGGPAASVMMLNSGGIEVASERVLAQLRERIVRFAASHIAGDAAEDVAQEVLILLHEKYAHLERPEDLLPVALQIVRFKVLSLRRKAARHGEYNQVSVTDIQLPDLGSSPLSALERQEMLGRLNHAVGQLGERCRELLRLKLRGKTFPEIQKIMGAASLNTVYTWDHRCRKNLLDLMGGDWEKP